MQDGPAPYLGQQFVRIEVALVDLKTRPIVERPRLPFLARVVGANGRVDDDEAGRDTPGLGQESLSVAGLEMTVEVCGKHAVESRVLEESLVASPQTNLAAGVRAWASSSIRSL